MAKALTNKQRNKIADKLMTWSNMVFAGLVVAQAFSEQFDFYTALAGVVIFVGGYLFAVTTMRGGGRK
jgi:hypothetical protein